MTRGVLRATCWPGSPEATVTADGWASSDPSLAAALTGGAPVISTEVGDPVCRAFAQAVRDLAAEIVEQPTPAPWPPPVAVPHAERPRHWCFAEPLDGPGEFALAGKDGKRVGQLLLAAERHGREAFARLAEQAVRRLLRDPDPMTAPVLFSDEELAELRDSLATSTAAADLLGRARVRRLAEFASRHQGAATFAEDDAFSVFDDVIEAARPEAAVEWFRTRVPALDVLPSRYAPRAYRQASVVAAAADEVLLQRVKAAILARLETGRGGAADVQDLLDAAGVSARNPQYADMLVRTNLTTAYAEGQDAEMSTPAMQEMFPAWRWDATVDERSRPDHAAREGKLYPSSVRFSDVRGYGPEHVANCRCAHSPVSKFMLAGRRVESSW